MQRLRFLASLSPLKRAEALKIGTSDETDADASSSKPSRVSFLKALATEKEDPEQSARIGSDTIDFNLEGIIEFREQQLVHTADRPPDEKHRKRPNYDSKKRKMLSKIPKERKGYLRLVGLCAN